MKIIVVNVMLLSLLTASFFPPCVDCHDLTGIGLSAESDAHIECACESGCETDFKQCSHEEKSHNVAVDGNRVPVLLPSIDETLARTASLIPQISFEPTGCNHFSNCHGLLVATSPVLRC